MAFPGVAERLRSQRGEVVGQREERNCDACWPQVNEKAANSARGDYTILSKLTGAHVMSSYELCQAAIARAGAKPPHDLKRNGRAHLRVIIKANAAIFACCKSDGLADIMQQRGHFHTRSSQFSGRKDALLFCLF